MANSLYQDRLVVVFARFDESTSFWIPMVDVSWGPDGQRESHRITGPLYEFANWQDAERLMTEMAKAWIDDHP